ncbi:MAG: UDP-N-acetylglucosamine 1-carboxyvinyltransferase [Clostridia bacterium]|nr:UDP-N-acetylglucosamine 1-carboxyvinyltransferase [Clostridia bacterium]
MSYFEIRGGAPLEGIVTISGAKNAGLGVIPAAILAGEACIIENLPYVSDVSCFGRILTQLGAKVSLEPNGVMTIDPSTINCLSATSNEVSSFRASYYLLGALLGRYGMVEIALPGGCDIGDRPIDQHIKGFEALGATVTIDEDNALIRAEAKRLVGCEVYLDMASVGATINIMLAATRAEGRTTIVNAAKEPYIVDIANFINMMGGSVRGAGTDEIKITGRQRLHGCTYAIIPDMMEAGTFMIAAAATGGNVVLNNVIPNHLDAISAKLLEGGALVEVDDDGRDFYVRVRADRRLRAVNIKTQYYPGFPTDLQQPMGALLTRAKGRSLLIEDIFEHRFKYMDELKRMGAQIVVNNRRAMIDGVEELCACDMRANDLRAGAALVIAALSAQGTSRVYGIKYIDRGYEHFEHKLRALGADITRAD